MLTKDAMREIVTHIDSFLNTVKGKDICEFIDALICAKRVFIYGVGRSGLVSKSFGVRLAHLDLPVFVVGETITPSIQKSDVLLAISGSGNTKSVVSIAETAKAKGARIIALTSNKNSKCGKLANTVFIVPGRTKDDVERNYLANQMRGVHQPLAPMGTLFEDACQVFLDGVIAELMHKLNATEGDMHKRHTNLEV